MELLPHRSWGGDASCSRGEEVSLGWAQVNMETSTVVAGSRATPEGQEGADHGGDKTPGDGQDDPEREVVLAEDLGREGSASRGQATQRMKEKIQPTQTIH